MERIRFNSVGQSIEGTVVTPGKVKEKSPGVIFFHGMTSNEKGYIPIAEKLADRGIVGMTLSIRGHGASEGNFNDLTVNDAVEDGLSAYDFFTKYNFLDKSRVGLCGASVGAAVISIVSARRQVQSLALRVPATYTEEMMGMTFNNIMAQEGQIFQKISNISDTPALQAISEFQGDLLVVTSENDTIIPVAIPKQYLLDAKNTRSKKKVVIKEATHNLSEQSWRDIFINEVVEWFVKTL